ncbi:MAG: translocation/assembly module TamB [Gemmatimonadota bacterium]|jgi:autotransporter translocation and assembly factor TamB|nr:translocation/assembly module TamB [Gemmatimonadota bacterium]
MTPPAPGKRTGIGLITQPPTRGGVGKKIWLVLTGLMTGLFGFALGLFFYIQAARVNEIRTGISERLNISRNMIDRVSVAGRDSIRFRVRDVVFRSESGDTILASSSVTLTLDTRTLSGTGPIEFHDLVLERPSLQVVQSPDGEWDYLKALGVEVGGQPVSVGGADGESRELLFHNVRTTGARVTLVMPGPPEPAGDAGFRMDLPYTTIDGVAYQRLELTGVSAVFSSIRVGGPEGWRVDIASLSGDLRQPELRIAELRGRVEKEGEDGARFEIARFRVGESVLAGNGLVRFPDEGVLYDALITANPLRMVDLEPVFPGREGDGEATFSLRVKSLSADRLDLAFSGLDFQGYDSRILGDIRVVAGGGPFTVLGGDLELAPLRLAGLRRAGILDPTLPLDGEITGRVGSIDGDPRELSVSLRASLTPPDQPEAEPSIVYAAGSITIGDALEALRLDGLDVGLRPLQMELLQGFFPADAAFANRLRGTVEGSVALAGSFTDLAFSDGVLVWSVDDAPPSQLIGLRGNLARDPDPRYRISATVSPLSLSALTALFPGLPFRSAVVTGPVELAGDNSGLSLSAILDGPAGGINIRGSAEFGDPLAFNLEGSLTAFEAGVLLDTRIPVDGSVSGSFAARGTTERLAFDVNLSQGEGRAALVGTVVTTAPSPVFDVAGQITNFRVGVVTGDPRLFPDPMSGSVALSGGGGAPYFFDVNLLGEVGRLTLAGFYRATEVPEYQIRGEVAGLDLGRLPVTPSLPESRINSRIDFAGRGVTRETLSGSFAFDATSSTVSGISFDDAVGRVQVAGGVAAFDTLLLRFGGSSLNASGSWGLSTPTAGLLHFALVSPDIGVLHPFLTSVNSSLLLSGSIKAEGTIGGSVEFPVVQAVIEGSDLRYPDRGLSARTLKLTLDMQRTAAEGWGGQGSLEGGRVGIPGFSSIQELQLALDGTQQSFAFSVTARRDADAEIIASGTLALDQSFPVEVGLETMTVRLMDRVWELRNAARIRVTDTEGIIVDNLMVESVGPDPGRLVMNGAIPRTGSMDFRVLLNGVDLADLHRLTERAPKMAGRFDLDATFLGPVGSPDVAISALVSNLVYEDVAVDLVAFDGILSGGRLSGSADLVRNDVGLFTAGIDIPMRLSLAELSPSFELPRGEPILIDANAESLPLGLVTAFIPGASGAEGTIRAEIEARGTLDEPVLAGTARLVDGAVRVDAIGVRYSGIDADITLDQNRILINSLNVRSGGRLAARGSIDFVAGAPADVELTVQMTDFRVINDYEGSQIRASSDLTLRGPASAPVLAGWVELFDSTIRVPEMGGGDADLQLGFLDVGQITPGLEDLQPPGSPLFANILIDGVELRIRESVWLESPELRAQITGDLVLYRSGEDLRIFGALDVVRGTYTLAVSGIYREFDITGGRVQFFGTGDLNPTLDVTAAYRVRGVTSGQEAGDFNVSVNLGGTLLAPTVTLGSDAPIALSEADLISYLIFGRPTFAIEGQFAQDFVVQELVGGVLTNRLQRAFPSMGICDWLRLRPGGAGNILMGSAVECGWELSSRLFATAQTGFDFFGGDQSEWGIALEWRINRRLSAETAYGDSYPSMLTRFYDSTLRRQLSIGLRGQWEYGRSPGAEPIEILPEPGVVPPSVSIAGGR